MKITKHAVLTLLVCLGLSCAGQAATRKPFVDYWVGIYRGSMQIGCLHTTISRDTLDGREVLRRDDRASFKKRDGKGSSLQVDSCLSVVVDKSFVPISEHIEFHGTSADLATKGKPEKTDLIVDSAYDAGSCRMVMTSDGERTEQTVAVSSKICRIDDFGGRKIAVGDDPYIRPANIGVAGSGFDRLTLSTHSQTFHVDRRDKVDANGTSYDAYTLVGEGSRATTWVTANCELVKADDPRSGVLLLRQSSEDALNWLASNGPNVLVVAANKQIVGSRTLEALQVRLLGVYDKGFVISDDRQKATYDAAKHSVDYSISAKAFDATKSIALPVKGKQYRKWLGASKGIEVGDKAIQALAKQIVGGETNAYKAACKLRAWVHGNIVYTDGADMPKSALAILEAKKGVCMDFSILYAALARASGIPTKVVVGLVYGTEQDGDVFSFHAWNESYVGEWVAMEPTWGDDVVDPTHIKMFEGGIETARDYYRATGFMTAEVVSATSPDHDGKRLAERSIEASNERLMWRSKGGELSWLLADMARTLPPPNSVPDGSIVIAYGDTGWQLILPPGSKINSRCASADSYCTAIILSEGIIFTLPDGSKILSGLGKN